MENMLERKYITKKGVIVLSSIFLLLLIALFVYINKSNQLEKQIISISGSSATKIDSMLQEIKKVKLDLVSEKRENDSLNKILIPLQPYRALVGMLSFRDSVQAELPFKIGEKVRYLPDSATAIVDEVNINGAGYSFNVNYSIIMKGNIQKNVPAHLIEKY